MVSIIIPTYNTAPLLAKMINCVISQSYTNWELILVDDGSTDGSVEMLENFVSIDHRIVFFQRNRLPKGGQTCRNIGLEMSRGEYIVFFDSDDLIAPYCIEQRVNFMEEERNRNIDFGIFPAHTFIDERNHATCMPFDKKYGINQQKDVLSSFLRQEYQFTIWTNIYRKTSLSNLTWDENVLLFQDLDFNISALLAGKNYAFADDCRFDYYYRILYDRNTVCSNFISKEKCESTIYLFSKIIDGLNMTPNSKKYMRNFIVYIALYYEHILLNGNTDNIEKYLNFCQYKYSKYFKAILNFITKIAMSFRDSNMRRKVAHALNIILIPRMGVSFLRTRLNILFC